MRIIFRYECRRLMWNRFFFGFLLILLLYGWHLFPEKMPCGSLRPDGGSLPGGRVGEKEGDVI